MYGVVDEHEETAYLPREQKENTYDGAANQQMFNRPGFGISIKRFQHKDSEHFKIRASGPVLEDELCAHWHFVTNLTEFRHAVKFTL